MDINSAAGDELFRWLMGISCLVLLTERTIHLALAKSSGGFRPKDRLSRFIGSDITLFMLTLFVSWAPIFYVIVVRGYSVSNIIDVLSQARASITLFGWAMTILVMIQALAPIIVGVSLLIGRHRDRKSTVDRHPSIRRSHITTK